MRVIVYYIVEGGWNFIFVLCVNEVFVSLYLGILDY